MKKIIVTGATSMIGIALIKECIRENIEVTAIIRPQTGRRSRLPKSELVKIVEADLDGLKQLELLKQDYDCLYHFAWGGTEKASRNNPEVQEKNILYTLDAVKLAYKAGCKKFIGAGSQAEYGICDDVTSPDSRVQPVSSYGICKYAAGKLSEKICEELGLVCLWGRIYSVYGENDNQGTMIRYALEKFHAGEIAHFSAGTQSWNYLHESDAGRMFFLMGEKCEKSKVYNIAHPVSQRLKEYIAELKEVLGDKFQYELESEKAGLLVCLNPDAEDTYRDLKYYPQISFKDGIAGLNEQMRQK